MKKVGLLLLFLVVGAYAYYRYYTTTPTYSLLKAAAAVQARDPTGFDQYVDVESVADGLLDDVGEQSGLTGLLNSNAWLAKSLGAALKPALVAGVKQQVATYIATGSVAAAQKAGGGNNSKFSLAALLGKVVSDSAEFKGVAFENTQLGGMAEVGLEFTQPRFDTTIVVKVLLADKGDHWQVKQIANAAEIFAHVSRLERDRLLRKVAD
jgi:hypothetical protein